MQVEIAADLENEFRVYWVSTDGKRAEQGVVTNDTDDTRNTAGRLVDEPHGFRLKKLAHISTGEADAGVDIQCGLP